MRRTAERHRPAALLPGMQCAAFGVKMAALLHGFFGGVDSLTLSRWDNDKEPAVRFFWLVLSLTFGPQGPLFRYILYHSAR